MAGSTGPEGTLPVAALDGVTMRWGERLVLDQLNLRVEAGERLVVVGPSLSLIHIPSPRDS